MRIATLVLATGLWLVSPNITFAAQPGGHSSGHWNPDGVLLARGGGGEHGGGGHGGGGGGFHGGGGGFRGGGGGFRGGGYRGGYGGGYGYGGFGLGLGYGLGGYGDYDYPYYSGDYYYEPSYDYATPSYGYSDYYDPYAGANVYQQPLIQQPAQASTAAPIDMEVIVPNPNAQLWLDGHLTTSTGTVRELATAPIPVGTYTYDIRASWNENGQTKTTDEHVNVIAGQMNRIDLTATPVMTTP